MGKKGKKAQAGKPKKLTPKDVSKRLNALAKNLEEELEGADLFAPLPPTEDCAICLVPLPRFGSETCYKGCCGNNICKACFKENEASIDKQNEENSGKKVVLTCPFCREARPATDEEYLRRLQARSLQNDHHAYTHMGQVYQRGEGTVIDYLKALDCWIRAIELGSPDACGRIGNSYDEGKGVAINMDRAAFFYRIGALRGHIVARNNIAYSEYNNLGNHEIGIRHWKIAAEAGCQHSLDALKKIYNADGKMPGKQFISQEEMDTVYRSGHEAQMEVKSEEREKHQSKVEEIKIHGGGVTCKKYT
jgi:hypothetical protein